MHKVQNKVEIENLIKKDNRIKNQIRSIEIENKIKNEIIAYDNHFTIEKLTYYIKDIIHSKTYNIENFNKLTERNNFLENENSYLNEERIKKNKIINKLNLEIIELKEKIEKQNITIESINKEEESVYKNTLIPEDDLHKRFNDFVNEICIVRPDVEELSVNLEGRYRLWNQKKPMKEVFHKKAILILDLNLKKLKHNMVIWVLN